MALDELEIRTPISSGSSTRASSGSLKKKSSLSRLFTSISRKSSKTYSTPPSPETPGTPKIPEHFLHDNKPATSDRYSAQKKPEETRHNGTSSRGKGNDARWVPSERSSERTSSGKRQEPKHRSGYSMEDVGGKEKAIPLYSPTYPVIPMRRAPKGLKFSNDGPHWRARGLSASLQKLGTRRRSPQRPATAGASLPRVNAALWFHEPTEYINAEESRTSVRSALTNTSSLRKASSTERFSVITRSTSVSESTVEIYERVSSKDGGMSVDDAIGMYVNGFEDDSESEPTNLTKTTATEQERRRSMKLAEAINDSMGSELLPTQRPSTSASRSSAAIMSGAAFKYENPKVPAILPPTSTRDQYGFLKANHHVSLEQYDAWYPNYSQIQIRRSKKWLSYMHECNLTSYQPSKFPPRSAKTQRYVRKGLPPEWRGSAWFFYSGGDALLQKQPDLYPTLVNCSSIELSSDDKELIERDLHRTFPDNMHFKPAAPTSTEQPLLSSLRNVLRAFSLHCPRIGYCQSLNFIAGLLLLFLSEEKTFWMLHIITTSYLPGTHEISLEGANVDLWVLMTALKESLPSIWSKITSGDDEAGSLGVKLPPISLCTTSWFMSLFIGTLPIESVLRVWDVLFYEGSRTLFRIAIAIFRLGEQRIRSVNESMEMFQVVQGLPREMLDVGLLMGIALKRSGVSQEWVDRRRWERKRWYAKERARRNGSVVDEREVDVVVGPRPRRAESMWRRRRK